VENDSAECFFVPRIQTYGSPKVASAVADPGIVERNANTENGRPASFVQRAALAPRDNY
jgi:hypothetical protein